MRGSEEGGGSERTWESRRRALSRVFLLVFQELPRSGGGRWSVNYQPVLGTGMGSTPQAAAAAAAVRRGRVHDRRIGEEAGAAGCEITFSITCRM